jgi:dGTPase
MGNPQLVPLDWHNSIQVGKETKARIISDYIAGMTDRYAIKEFQNFYNLTFSNF